MFLVMVWVVVRCRFDLSDSGCCLLSIVLLFRVVSIGVLSCLVIVVIWWVVFIVFLLVMIIGWWVVDSSWVVLVSVIGFLEMWLGIGCGFWFFVGMVVGVFSMLSGILMCIGWGWLVWKRLKVL